MNIENQVCTLEQAKKLKELGVNAESLFWWTQDKTPSSPNLHYYGWSQESMPWGVFFGQRSRISTSDVFEEYSAYTVAELGEMLPSKIEIKGASYIVTSMKSAQAETGVKYSWTCRVWNTKQGLFKKEFGETEAQARAAMLIYLLENKLITV